MKGCPLLLADRDTDTGIVAFSALPLCQLLSNGVEQDREYNFWQICIIVQALRPRMIFGCVIILVQRSHDLVKQFTIVLPQVRVQAVKNFLALIATLSVFVG